jgi:hypothetical protein
MEFAAVVRIYRSRGLTEVRIFVIGGDLWY